MKLHVFRNKGTKDFYVIDTHSGNWTKPTQT